MSPSFPLLRRFLRAARTPASIRKIARRNERQAHGAYIALSSYVRVLRGWRCSMFLNLSLYMKNGDSKSRRDMLMRP
jgi:hypothetical protein